MLKMQPTFAVVLPVSADQAMATIRSVIDSSSLEANAQSAGRCIDFRIADEDQRFWSPHLSVQLSEWDSGTRLFGRFSPRPEIWTMFMAIYFIAAIGGFAAVIYGYVQWAMGATPWALLGLPMGLMLILALHLASVIGQNLSSDQMDLLRSQLDRTLEIAFDERNASTTSDVHAAKSPN